MNKKLILLILIFPVIAMITLFSTTKTVANIVDISVSNLEVLNDKTVFLNLEEHETHKIKYSVYPTDAKNTEVEFKFEAVGDDPMAELDIHDDVIYPVTAGVTRVIISSIDGGYTDSLIVHVVSNSIQGVNISTDYDLNNIYVGSVFSFKTSFTPANANNKAITYTSSNSLVASVDSKTGRVKANSVGYAIIRVTSVADPDKYSQEVIEVKSNGVINLSDMQIATSDLYYATNYVTVVTDKEYSDSDISFDYDSTLIKEVKLEKTFEDSNQKVYKINSEFAQNDNSEFETNITIRINFQDSTIEQATYSIQRTYSIANLKASDDLISLNKNENSSFYLSYSPDTLDLEYSLQYDRNIVEVENDGDFFIVNALNYGHTEIRIKILNYTADDVVVDAVVYPSSISIDELANTYGISNEFAFGKNKYDTSLVADSYQFNYTTKNDVTDEIKNEYFKWTSSNDNIATINNGLLKVTGNGVVTISIGFMYGDTYFSVSKMNVKCISAGVNVYSYQDLMRATNSGYEVVLQKDITSDFGQNYQNTYKEITSTYDITFYENIYRFEHGIDMNTELSLTQKAEADKRAKIKILVDFNNNVYGNGHTINAHNLAYGIDATGALRNDAIFRGPLNFVGLTNEGVSLVSVKGQDNISFAIRENVTVDNVILKSCNDVSDLTLLDYVGTTVEILGNNASILNSRIKNGRSTVRVFGSTDPNEKINVKIENCEISYAREFLIRAGANKAIVGKSGKAAPYLGGYLMTAWNHNEADKDTKSEKYDNDYINTFLTVKNSSFKQAGLFAIALDSHFAGEMLAGSYAESAYGDILKYWHNLAATSYGVKLSLDGNVKFENWVDISKIDSSSLIDISDQLTNGELDVSINLGKLIEKVYSNDKSGQYKSIIYDDGINHYIHGGICLFGGGKNYSYINTEKLTGVEPSRYVIGLTDTEDTAILSKAAGVEPFRFYIYSSDKYTN